MTLEPLWGAQETPGGFEGRPGNVTLEKEMAEERRETGVVALATVMASWAMGTKERVFEE